MLASIRKFSKSFIAKIFIAIIALPFIMWGMGDVFRSGNQNTLVEINKKKINTDEFVTYLRRLNLSSEQVKKIGKEKIFNDALTNYISEKIISLETDKKNIKLTDKSLLRILMTDKNFQKDNTFSQTKYEKFMLTSGYTKTRYEKTIKNIEQKGQLLSFYSGGIKLPSFIIKDIYQNENQSKEISFLDLDKIYENNIIAEEKIKNFYEENKDSFSDKFKSFRYVELKPENLVGNNEPNEEYFKKIDQIENNILDGNTFDQIINDKKNIITIEKINLRRKNNDGKKIENIDTKLFQKIFSIDQTRKPEFINLNNKFYVAEITEEEDVLLTLNDVDLKKSIKNQLKILTIIKENAKISDDIKNKKFNKKEMILMSEKKGVKIEKNKIKNIKDTSKFSSTLVEEIYKYNTGQVFVLSDSLLRKNYIVSIDRDENIKINVDSKIYKEYVNRANSVYIKKIFKSYDNYINANYKIDTNEKVLERLKNSF